MRFLEQAQPGLASLSGVADEGSHGVPGRHSGGDGPHGQMGEDMAEDMAEDMDVMSQMEGDAAEGMNATSG